MCDEGMGTWETISNTSWGNGCDRVDGAGDGDGTGPRPAGDCWANAAASAGFTSAIEQRPGGTEDPPPGFVGAADQQDSAPPLGGWFAIE